MNRSALAPRRTLWRAALLLLAGLAATVCGWAEHIVAVADIHGAYDQFVAILQTAGVIDKDRSWTGGKTVLVQTGDEVDRGPRSREAMDLLMGLGEKAPQQGGEVRALLGNHETMVMMGDLRYVSPEEYHAFAAPDSEKLRQSEFEDYARYMKQRAAHLHQSSPSLGETDKQAWLAAHPPGYFEYRDALAPKGKYGQWLRSREAVTQVGDVIFLHGGLSPQSPLKSVKEINEKVHREMVLLDDIWAKLSKKGVLWPYLNLEEAQREARAEWQIQQSAGDAETTKLLQSFLELRNLNIISPEGPLWSRGYATEPEGEFSPQLDKVLKRFKVRYVVVGHTIPNSKRITPRFDGRIFLIDTGMLASYFQGRPSALDINDDHFKALYVGETPQALTTYGDAKAQ